MSKNNGGLTSEEKKKRAKGRRAACRRAQAEAKRVTPGGYKVRASCQYLGGISKPTLYRAVKRGLLRPCLHFRHLIFTKVELDRFLSDGMSNGKTQ